MTACKRPTDLYMGYVPLPAHVPFHASKARTRIMIGGLGSGKSSALVAEAIKFNLTCPGANTVISRRYGPALKRSAEAAFFEMMPAELLAQCKVARSGGRVECVTFPTMSKLWFLGLQDPVEWKSTEFSGIFLEEVDEQDELTVLGGIGRLRQQYPMRAAVDAGLTTATTRLPNIVCMASNPDGKNWVWAAGINPETRWPGAEAWVSTTLDNPYLPAAYVRDLLSKPLPFVRRYVLSQFDDIAGAMYPTWTWDTCVVPRPSLAADTEIWQMLDPGIGPDKLGVVWAVVDRGRGRLVVIKEYLEGELPAAGHAERWRAIEAQFKPARVTRRVSDPSISRRDAGTNMRLSDIYSRLGFSFQPGPVSYQNRLGPMQEAVASGGLVCTEDCPRFFEQMSMARWMDQVSHRRDREGDFTAKPKKGKDDLHDAVSYGVAIHVRGAVALPAATPTGAEPDTAAKIKAQIKRGKAARTRLPGMV